MKWAEFIQSRESYEQVWAKLKEESSGDLTKYLKRSYIEIFYGQGCQISWASNDPVSIALSNSDFLIEDYHSKSLLSLARAYKSITDKNTEQAKDILSQMKSIKPELLSVQEFYVDIIFPTMDIDLIQEIKRSKWIDQSRVKMSKAYIRTPLRKGLDFNVS